ncbi:DUF6894 family protein [Pararhizobium gei]|uniref:DUF6894 family protein n=1 Tax=Pararhizobium gei TaxID=1395951 RepID=UPI0023DB4816|nr:hypothetical protein [Rhizobium gei]
MRVHFTFNDGGGIEPDGTFEFKSIEAAKAEALLALTHFLQEDLRRSGVILGSVAGHDEQGKTLFTVTMRVEIEEAGTVVHSK